MQQTTEVNSATTKPELGQATNPPGIMQPCQVQGSGEKLIMQKNIATRLTSEPDIDDCVTSKTTVAGHRTLLTIFVKAKAMLTNSVALATTGATSLTGLFISFGDRLFHCPYCMTSGLIAALITGIGFRKIQKEDKRIIENIKQRRKDA